LQAGELKQYRLLLAGCEAADKPSPESNAAESRWFVPLPTSAAKEFLGQSIKEVV
jgi:hypothetical protein